jgi:pantoate--beta-alanine ligase
MIIIDSPRSMLEWSRDHIRQGFSVGFVPTMGALHQGHRELIETAKNNNDLVVVSIFVNPLQFNVQADFDKYPRPIETDTQICTDIGVDVVYAPTASLMYPSGFETRIEPGTTAEPLEGAGRPGHFSGVLTVVAKLLNAVAPTRAYFGQKDYQQLAVVSQMIKDLDMGIEIVAVPTVRESDGLALSSRNVRLSMQDREAATIISRALAETRQMYASGERDVQTLESYAQSIISAESRARIEYVAIADAITLQPLNIVDRPAVLAAAVWFGDVRLIDNMRLG